MFFVSFVEEEMIIYVHGIKLLRIVTLAVCVYGAVRTEFVNVLKFISVFVVLKSIWKLSHITLPIGLLSTIFCLDFFPISL